MTIEWEQWGQEVIENTHGKVSFYRDLYEGKHAKLFSRAKELIDKGEIVDNIMNGPHKAQNVQTPYIIANVSKLIPEIPAMLVSRSIGNVSSSLPAREEKDHGEEGLLEQIEKNSSLRFEHWSNLVQHQVDGGLVGVPFDDDRGLRIDFKQRDVYYPHEDDKGCDLAYHRTIEGKEYLHIYRERVEEGGLRTTHMLKSMREKSGGKLEDVEESLAAQLLGIEKLENFYDGRNRPFVVYWPNEKTFMQPLGTSCLRNQEGRQDEINWTLTRNAITFERNGKPRLAVSKSVFRALQKAAKDRYGDESRIDHRDLEITELDENGNAMQVIQIDITKIGDIQWVKDLMKLMFVETRTSEKAVDFYLDQGAGAAQSGVAKFYDLFVSLTKGEQLQGEYVYFLQQLFENALWLAKQDDPAVQIEEPDIILKSMVPISRKELMEENNSAFVDGTQSLKTTVQRNNPLASEEWIEEELIRIEQSQQVDDTNTLIRAQMSMKEFMDNRDENGDPIKDDDE